MVDVTVILATYNRSEVLRQTLEAFLSVDLDGMSVEFVVVDNNSADDTGEVLASYEGRLPLRPLFQPRQGKSAALNLALDTVELGDIVVFSDDDVIPNRDWLQQVRRACAEWPDCNVFGGRIQLVWPEGHKVPDWAYRDDMQWVFSPHELDGECGPYPENIFPSGPNTWVRREMCQDHRYHEELGPGNAWAPGEDVLFVKELIDLGNPARYVHVANVGHIVHPLLLTETEVLRRAFRYGRGITFRMGLSRKATYDKHPIFWLLLQSLSIMKYGIAAALLRLPLRGEHFFLKSVNATRALGLNIAQFRIGWMGIWKK